jgi:uncharacterized membrane protein
VAAFSDAVFAVIVTIMVLELKALDQAAFSALWPLCQLCGELPVHRHHLGEPPLPVAIRRPTLRLIWINFIHLYYGLAAALVTAWVARTQLASSPVALYAGLFVAVDVAYNIFEHEILVPAGAPGVRSYAAFGEAPITRRPCELHDRLLVALVAPRVGFGLICAALILHLRPEVPEFTDR